MRDVPPAARDRRSRTTTSPFLRTTMLRAAHIAMEHAMAVRVCERIGGVTRDAQRVLRGQRAARDEIRERLALDPLDSHVGPAVHVTDVEHRRQGRMREPAGGACLAQEAAPRLRDVREPFRQDLQRQGQRLASDRFRVPASHDALPGECQQTILCRPSSRGGGGEAPGIRGHGNESRSRVRCRRVAALANVMMIPGSTPSASCFRCGR
jgi:hypothetical protein